MRIAAIVLLGLSSCLFGTALDAQAQDEIARLPTQTFADPNTVAGDARRAGAGSADIKILTDQSDLRLSATANPVELDNNTRKFLDDNAAPLGLADTGSELNLKETKRSLSGTYLNYEQTIGDIPILDSQIAVSVGKGGHVRSVVRNVVRVPLAKMDTVARSSRISEQQAYEIAWQDLGARGHLLEAPSISTAYLNENNTLTLVYVVRVAVEQPLGYWEFRIDANTGRIVQRLDRRVEQVHPRKTTGDDEPVGGTARIVPGTAEVSFADALARFTAKKEAARAATPLAAARFVNATGVIFDPNPLTALNDFRLKDRSGAQKFDRAYTKVTLTNVTESNGRLYLNGPNVRIEDFEPGDGERNRAPSSVTREWTAHRGNNAFNDVMTYYFLQVPQLSAEPWLQRTVRIVSGRRHCRFGRAERRRQLHISCRTLIVWRSAMAASTTTKILTSSCMSSAMPFTSILIPIGTAAIRARSARASATIGPIATARSWTTGSAAMSARSMCGTA